MNETWKEWLDRLYREGVSPEADHAKAVLDKLAYLQGGIEVDHYYDE